MFVFQSLKISTLNISILLLIFIYFNNINAQFDQLSSRRTSEDQMNSILGSRINSQSVCRNIKGLGPPINIFRQYIHQIYTNFALNSDTDNPVLVYHREIKEKYNINTYIFKVHNVYSRKHEFIGIVSLITHADVDNGSYHQIIIRYVNSLSFETIKILLGVHEADEDSEIPCTNMKEDLMESLIKKPVIPNNIRH